MKGRFSCAVVCLIALLPNLFALSEEPQPEVLPKSQAVDTTSMGNSPPGGETPVREVSTSSSPDVSTQIPPDLNNATVIDGNNSTTVVGNTTVTVIGNDTIIVSKPGNNVTVTVLPGGGVAINVVRPGQNISIRPEGTIVSNGPVSQKSHFFKMTESIAFRKPDSNLPLLNLPLFQTLPQRRRYRLPFLIRMRDYAPLSVNRPEQYSNVGLDGQAPGLSTSSEEQPGVYENSEE